MGCDGRRIAGDNGGSIVAFNETLIRSPFDRPGPVGIPAEFLVEVNEF